MTENMNNMDMINTKDIIFKEYNLESLTELDKFFKLRKCYSTQGNKFDVYIWHELSKTQYAVVDDKILFIIYGDKKEHAYIPFCKEEDLPFAVELLRKYFNEVYNQKLKINYVDEYSVEILKNANALDLYEVTELPEYADYIYDGESLRTLAGRKLSRKRNYIHRFLKEYDGRYEYKKLTMQDKDAVMYLYRKWLKEHIETGIEYDGLYKNMLTCEEDFVEEIFTEEKLFNELIIGGIFIDNKLAEFSIGSYDEMTKQALILIEKADRDIVGLYPMINQQFLINEFKEAVTINREDASGIEELKQAKEQYFPIKLEKKFLIKEK